ncbi:MAG: signal peptidase I [Bacilli bacterium]|jgi:signal peptidase I
MVEIETALKKEEHPEVEDKKEEREGKWKKVLSIILTVLFILFMIIGSGLIFVDTYYMKIYVSGTSMYPTLENQEFGLVDNHKKAIDKIKRGDIIVFKHYTSDGFEHYIKRVIALPNEGINFIEGGVNAEDTVQIRPVDSEEYVTLDEAYLTSDAKQNTAKGNLASYPKNLDEFEYFVMGDNRANSSDSRVDDVGLIKREDIVGVLVLITGHVDEILEDGKYKGKHYYLLWDMRRY